jgi:hypothetical protein
MDEEAWKLTSPEHYRQEAERVRRLAETVSNEAIRHQLLAICQSYEALAATAEMLART